LILKNQNLINVKIKIKRIKIIFDKKQKKHPHLDFWMKSFNSFPKVPTFLFYNPYCFGDSYFGKKIYFFYFSIPESFFLYII